MNAEKRKFAETGLFALTKGKNLCLGCAQDGFSLQKLPDAVSQAGRRLIA